MPTFNWLTIAEKLGIPAAAMAVLFAILHYDLIAPMNSREERHLKNQERISEAMTAQTELLRSMAYDTKYGTWRITEPPKASQVDTSPPPPPPTKAP